VRRTVPAIAALAVALVVQLTVLNGLHLPGGGVPDLVLVLVGALAMTDGPVRGMIMGFAAGLALDIAPPGSAVLGEYALVFCLVGWAAGRLAGLLNRSAFLSLLALAGIIAVGEAMTSAIQLGLQPGQVNVAEIRLVLPATVGYDLLILPFVLYLALLSRAWAPEGRPASDFDSHGALAVAGRHKRPGHKGQPREPRLGPDSYRPHDGWVGSTPASRGRPATRRPAAPHGLRPSRGVAGSAVTGVTPRPGRPAAPVNLRFSSRRGSGVVGSPVGSALGRQPSHHPGLHPGALRHAGGRGFRPHAGVPGGSATRQPTALTRPPARRPASVRFSSRRGDGSVGRPIGTPRPVGGGPGLLDASGRFAAGLLFRRAAAPRFKTASLAPARSRPKAAPRFRRAYATATPALATRLASGGALDQRDLLSARRRQMGVARLRLGSRRRRDGIVGGSAARRRLSVRPAAPRFRVGSSARPAVRSAPRRPRFGYGRRSLLAFLAGNGVAGKWLGNTRIGTRARVWLIGSRIGGAR
jgi:rod shape-determining protein MreD